LILDDLDPDVWECETPGCTEFAFGARCLDCVEHDRQTAKEEQK
jgi:hypothetical protein